MIKGMDDIASDALTGRLLVATPLLEDPNFHRTVVLVVEHEPGQGTLGVVLNRPTEVPVGQVLEPWTELATDPPVVFTGGPVSPNSALALALVPGPRRAGRLASAGRRRPGHDQARPGRPRRPAWAAGPGHHQAAGLRRL